MTSDGGEASNPAGVSSGLGPSDSCSTVEWAHRRQGLEATGAFVARQADRMAAISAECGGKVEARGAAALAIGGALGCGKGGGLGQPVAALPRALQERAGVGGLFVDGHQPAVGLGRVLEPLKACLVGVQAGGVGPLPAVVAPGPGRAFTAAPGLGGGLAFVTGGQAVECGHRLEVAPVGSVDAGAKPPLSLLRSQRTVLGPSSNMPRSL